jgi:predicted DNA-binding transcriptional regulator AlpA
MTRKLIREKHLREQKLGGISRSTFFRRFRHHKDAPKPVNTPDGMLAWWEDEWDGFLESLGRTDDPRADVSDLPEHWLRSKRRNQRGNSEDTTADVPPQAALLLA